MVMLYLCPEEGQEAGEPLLHALEPAGSRDIGAMRVWLSFAPSACKVLIILPSQRPKLVSKCTAW